MLGAMQVAHQPMELMHIQPTVGMVVVGRDDARGLTLARVEAVLPEGRAQLTIRQVAGASPIVRVERQPDLVGNGQQVEVGLRQLEPVGDVTLALCAVRVARRTRQRCPAAGCGGLQPSPGCWAARAKQPA